MKCQSKQLGLLQDPERPGWICENEGDYELELKGKEGKKLMTADLCADCLKAVLHIIGEGKSAKPSLT